MPKLDGKTPVGQISMHSIQSLQYLKYAESGTKATFLLIPLPTNPTALFPLTSAQYLTHKPQRIQ